MEENKSKHPARRGEVKNKLKKIITFFTCVVLVLSSVLLYTQCRSLDGYSYYTLDNNLLIGKTVQENFLDKVVEQERVKLENEGYYIVSMRLDPDVIIKEQIIQKSQANENDLKANLIKCIDTEVLLTQLTITGEDNIYYFKTDEECKTFVNELTAISKVETKSEGTVGKDTLISSQQSLQSLKNKYQEIENAAAAKRKAEQARTKVAVTSRGGSVSRTNKKYSVPMASYVYISSEYGPRWGSTHTGVDFAASTGTSIYSWKDGVVTTACWSGGYGNFIEVRHNDGTVSRYGHCSKIAVSKGQTVSAGQTIGYVGSTGNSTGPHLHFEIKVNGSFVNPLNYL